MEALADSIKYDDINNSRSRLPRFMGCGMRSWFIGFEPPAVITYSYIKIKDVYLCFVN